MKKRNTLSHYEGRMEAWSPGSHLGTMRGMPENTINSKESRPGEGKRKINIFIIGLAICCINKNTYIFRLS